MESSHSRAAWLNSTYTHTHRERPGSLTMTTAPACVYSFPAFLFFCFFYFPIFLLRNHVEGGKKRFSFFFVFGVSLLYIYFLSSGRHVATFGEPAGPVVLSSRELWVELGGLGCWVFPSFVSFFFFVFRGGFLRGWMEEKEKEKKGEMAGRLDGWMDEGKVEDPPRRGFG